MNRLGSFVNWPFSRHAKSFENAKSESVGSSSSVVNMSPFKLCDNGLFLKANDQLSMYNNDRIELNCLSAEASLAGSQKSQIEFIGSQHKVLKGLPSRNIPLSRSLNYLSP